MSERASKHLPPVVHKLSWRQQCGLTTTTGGNHIRSREETIQTAVHAEESIQVFRCTWVWIACIQVAISLILQGISKWVAERSYCTYLSSSSLQGSFFVHYMPPRLNRNRLQVWNSVYVALYLFIIFFLSFWIFGHAILCRQPHLAFHPITSDLHTGTRKCAFILHKCPNIPLCECSCSSHTHILRVPCHLHPSACSE